MTTAEDDAARLWLALLRDGTPERKAAARYELGEIFERRGLLAEAAECYGTNILEGARDRALCGRLAGVYRRQGRDALADEVLAEPLSRRRRKTRAVSLAHPTRRRRRRESPGTSLRP